MQERRARKRREELRAMKEANNTEERAARHPETNAAKNNLTFKEFVEI